MKSKEETIKEYLHKLIDDGFPLTQDNTLMFTDGFSQGIEFASQSKWIDVNQGLPDDNFWYRVLVDGKHDILPYSCLDGEWWCYGESHSTNRNITHYQSFEDLP